MKADEVEMRSDPAVRIIFLVRAMFKECPEKVCRSSDCPGPVVSGPPIRAPGKSTKDRVDSKVV